MKKFGLKLIGLVLVSMLLCGCYSYKLETTVNKDKSMDFKMEMAIDLSSYASMLGDDYDPSEMTEEGGMLTEEQQKELKEQGYEVNYSQEKYKTTITVFKKFKNIDEISSDKDVEVDINKIGEKDFEEVFFTKKGETYKGHLVFDPSAADMDDMSELGMSKEDMGKYFKLEYRLNLPVKAKSNNATKTENDGKTLIWELPLTQKTDINYEFELGASNTMLIVGIAVLVVAAIGVGVYLVTKKKPAKKEK